MQWSSSEELRPKVGIGLGGLCPQTTPARRICGGLVIHPRAQHGAFWPFHVNDRKKGVAFFSILVNRSRQKDSGMYCISRGHGRKSQGL
jgi:hypothetical protein